MGDAGSRIQTGIGFASEHIIGFEFRKESSALADFKLCWKRLNSFKVWVMNIKKGQISIFRVNSCRFGVTLHSEFSVNPDISANGREWTQIQSPALPAVVRSSLGPISFGMSAGMSS